MLLMDIFIPACYFKTVQYAALEVTDAGRMLIHKKIIVVKLPLIRCSPTLKYVPVSPSLQAYLPMAPFVILVVSIIAFRGIIYSMINAYFKYHAALK